MKTIHTTLALLSLWACGCAGESQPQQRSAAALDTAVYHFETTVAAGKCLDVSGAGSADGTLIQEWDCNGTVAQLFRKENLADGSARLVNPTTGKCVDVAAAGTANGTQLQLWTCNGTPAQSFNVVDAGGGNVSFVNPHSNRCIDVNAQATANGTKVQLWDCNGTKAQIWHPTLAGSVDPPPPASGPIVAGYYPNWTESPVRIRDLDSHYNLIYLFAAVPVGGAPGTTGAVTWSPPGDGRGAATNLVADLQYARSVQQRKIVLSVGGASNGMSFPNRTKTQTFVDSIAGIYNQLGGGLDGLDWNTFEGSQAPDTGEMIWASQQLKQRYPGFLITAPPAPWNSVDKTFCAAMNAAGVLDYCAPQYYDGPGLAVPSYIVSNVNDWIALLGPSKVVVGFGIWNQPNYESIGDAVSAWQQIKGAHPTVRGAFDWTAQLDESQGWPFARQLGPLVP